MLVRLKTVRAKLTALVALSGVIMLATLPLLSWLLHRQLIDEVDDRVTEAERAFQAELDDDLADLTLASRIMASDADTARAIAARDPKAASDVGHVFLGVYPEMDILFILPDGHVLAQIGCSHAPETVRTVEELKGVLDGTEIHGVIDRGCEVTQADAPPAYVIATPIKGGGAVIVCLPLNTEYLRNASSKL